jgi:1,5-anhydro-D-fructose reductase (1,5-anhydro-D-mannitol-forming)
MVRTALLSMAHVHAMGYARALQRHPEAEIVCVWDDDAARGRTAARSLEVPSEDDLHAILGSTGVDGVVLNSETSKHGDLILAAAAAGKHVFTEKALTITTSEADAVVEAVQRAGIQFVISLPQRSQPETLYLKQVLDAGLVGRPTLMRARIAHSAALDRWFKDGSLWFGDPALAGGGSLFDLGCHTVDAMRWLLGAVDSVVAITTNLAQAYEIDDQCVATLRFRSGAIGILDVSWVHRAGPNTWEIYGTDGFVGRGFPGAPLLLQGLHADVGGTSGTFLPGQLPPAAPSPLEQWVAAIEHGTPPLISVEDGRNLTSLLEAIYTSAREGRAVQPR